MAKESTSGTMTTQCEQLQGLDVVCSKLTESTTELRSSVHTVEETIQSVSRSPDFEAAMALER